MNPWPNLSPLSLPYNFPTQYQTPQQPFPQQVLQPFAQYPKPQGVQCSPYSQQQQLNYIQQRLTSPPSNHSQRSPFPSLPYSPCLPIPSSSSSSSPSTPSFPASSPCHPSASPLPSLPPPPPVNHNPLPLPGLEGDPEKRCNQWVKRGLSEITISGMENRYYAFADDERVVMKIRNAIERIKDGMNKIGDNYWIREGERELLRLTPFNFTR